MEERFDELFGRRARAVQLSVEDEVECCVGEGRACVMELPTGSGKSLIGLYACVRAKEVHDASKLVQESDQQQARVDVDDVGFGCVYVCSSINLQRQIYRDARRCTAFTNVFTLLGIHNYLCAARAKAFIEDGVVDQVDLARGVAVPFFRTMLAQAKTRPDAHDSFWCVSHREQWMAHANQRGVRREDAQRCWKEVCADQSICDCFKTLLNEGLRDFKGENRVVMALQYAKHAVFCPSHVARRVHAPRADLLVVNMSLLCTYAAHGIDRLNERFFVIDEAHELPEKAEPIYDAASPPPLHANKVLERVSEWMRQDVRLVDPADFDLAVFERAFRDERVIAFTHEGVRRAFRRAKLVYHASSFARIAKWLAEVDDEIDRHLGEAGDEDEVEDGGQPGTEAGGEEFAARERERERRRVFSILSAARAWTGYDDVLYRAVVKLTPDGTPVELRETLDEVQRTIRALVYASKATNREEWLADEHTRCIAPEANQSGMCFKISQQRKAEELHNKLWSKFAHPPLLLSATLTHQGSFRPFCDLIGLETPLTTARPSTFPAENRVFYFPAIAHPYNSSKMRSVRGYRAAHAAEVLSCIARCVALNPKSTLVVGPNLEELHALRRAMETALPDLGHIDFKDTDRFDAFQGSEARAVIYGSMTLATGVDLPGRLGLVVVMRAMQLPLAPAEEYAKDYLGLGREMWDQYYARSALRFEQACGRLVRRATDQGVILYFSKLTRSAIAAECDLVLQRFGAHVTDKLAAWPFSRKRGTTERPAVVD